MDAVARRLALLTALGGVTLLAIAPLGDNVKTQLGSVLLVAAVLLLGVGKGVEFLGYVGDGAAGTERSAEDAADRTRE